MWVSTYTFHHIVSDTVMHLISIKMQQLWCVSAMTARGGGGIAWEAVTHRYVQA